MRKDITELHEKATDDAIKYYNEKTLLKFKHKKLTY